MYFQKQKYNNHSNILDVKHIVTPMEVENSRTTRAGKFLSPLQSGL